MGVGKRTIPCVPYSGCVEKALSDLGQRSENMISWDPELHKGATPTSSVERGTSFEMKRRESHPAQENDKVSLATFYQGTN